MTDIHTWLATQSLTLHEPIPDSPPELEPDLPTTRQTKHALEAALDHIALAVAALYRAGPYFARKSQSFWYFAAGSWQRQVYDREVENASKLLPEWVSVACDIAWAEERVVKAIGVLRRQGDVRDARDLGEALEGFRAGGGG